MKKCYLCHNTSLDTIHYGVRDNRDINVLKCNRCGLVQLSDDSHIDRTFYEESKMFPDIKPIEEWRIETEKDDIRRATMFENVYSDKKIIDIGSGNGGFLKIISDKVEQMAGLELDKAVVEFYKKDKISLYDNIEQIPFKADVITMFHVLEHLKDPINVLKSLDNILEDKGKIIIEVPNADDILLKTYHSDAFADFTYWSCHLFLYNTELLRTIGIEAGYEVLENYQIQRYSVLNHLYWLSNGKPGGHNIWKTLYDENLDKAYIEFLKKTGQCDTCIIVLGKKKKDEE